jgi:hypothetical protein
MPMIKMTVGRSAANKVSQQSDRYGMIYTHGLKLLYHHLVGPPIVRIDVLIDDILFISSLATIYGCDAVFKLTSIS